jgi:hypothetical protein
VTGTKLIYFLPLNIPPPPLWADQQVDGHVLCNYGPPSPIPYSGVGEWGRLPPLSIAITNNYTVHSCSQSHVHKITNVPVFYLAVGLNDFLWGQIQYGLWKWIFPLRNHFVPRHLHIRYINSYISKWRMEFQNPKYSMSSYVPFAIVILDYKTSPVFSSCFILTNFMMFFLSMPTGAQLEN